MEKDKHLLILIINAEKRSDHSYEVWTYYMKELRSEYFSIDQPILDDNLIKLKVCRLNWQGNSNRSECWKILNGEQPIRFHNWRSETPYFTWSLIKKNFFSILAQSSQQILVPVNVSAIIIERI